MDIAALGLNPALLPELTRRVEGEIKRRAELRRLEASFGAFVEAAWHVIDPSPYEHNWHIDAIVLHLEAVARGEIRNLLINIPPRHSKTLITSVLFPCWVWTQQADPDCPLMGPEARFLCLSYAEQVVFDSAVTARRLVESDWYQARWGSRVKITSDQGSKSKFDTTAGGTRISAPIGGQVLGRGASIRIIDDPVKVDDANSEIVLSSVVQTYEETLRSRVTDPRTTATITVMQRISAMDLSGHILDTEPDTVHLCIPEEFDPVRKCVTVLGWEDPRSEPGELLWPERFDDSYLAPFKRNSYVWAGQYQQMPSPRGGGIFKEEWWQPWPPIGEERQWTTLVPVYDSRGLKTGEKESLRYPEMDMIVASVDTAMTTKEENDWSALTIWGTWTQHGLPRIMLMEAWQVRLEFRPLVDKIIATCRKRKVDKLLIEAKSNGISVGQEIVRLCGGHEWSTQLVGVEGDKRARAYSIQHLFEAKCIYAPMTEPPLKWVEAVIGEMSVFDKGKHDDLVDSSVHALRYLRAIGVAQLKEERDDDMRRKNAPGSGKGSVASMYGVG